MKGIFCMLPIILAIRDEEDRNFVSGIYEDYGKQLYKTAFSILNSNEDAEDCVHDVIVALIDNLEKIRTFESNHQIKYIIKCCRNIALNRYRANSVKSSSEFSTSYSEEEGEMDIPDDNSDVALLVVDAENNKRLITLIQDLPEIYSDALYFRFYIGMTNGEIAKMLGITIHAVEIRVSKAEAMLRKMKGDELNDIRRK